MATGVVSRHRAWVEIDHAALAANLAAIRGLVGGHRAVIGVVKANAYGHGAIEVASTLVAAGVEHLAVATLSEADELRAAGIGGPILLLWTAGPEDAERLVAAEVEPMVTDGSEVTWLDTASAASGRRLAVHLKLDTGLGRQGASPGEAAELAARIAASPHLRLAGTMTHLATAEDPAYTGVQLQRLADALDGIRRLGVDPGLVHFGATGAILARLPDLADAVRPGLGLYGLVPPWADATDAGLRPVLSLRAHPIRVFDVPAGTPIGYGLRWRAERPSRLATLPIGYGDGWPRLHDNNGFALVRGLRVPMVGAISMDGLVVDVTDAGDVGPNDEVVLIGRQDEAEITVDEVARQRRTINYEVTTSLRRRLPRKARDR